MRMRDCCCHYCTPPKRHPGCHDHCPERAAELEAQREKVEAARKRRETEYGLLEQQRRAYEKTNGRRHWNG